MAEPGPEHTYCVSVALGFSSQGSWLLLRRLKGEGAESPLPIGSVGHLQEQTLRWREWYSVLATAPAGFPELLVCGVFPSRSFPLSSLLCKVERESLPIFLNFQIVWQEVLHNYTGAMRVWVHLVQVTLTGQNLLSLQLDVTSTRGERKAFIVMGVVGVHLPPGEFTIVLVAEILCFGLPDGQLLSRLPGPLREGLWEILVWRLPRLFPSSSKRLGSGGWFFF